MDASNIMKPFLSRGEIQVIGATTVDEYRKYIEKDPALERRFQPMLVEEPSREETVEIFRGLRPVYEKHHGVTISDEALEAAVKLSERYINDRFLPDKAIDLMDESAARRQLGLYHLPARIQELEEGDPAAGEALEEAVRQGDFEAPGNARPLWNSRVQPAPDRRSRPAGERRSGGTAVTEEDVAAHVSDFDQDSRQTSGPRREGGF